MTAWLHNMSAPPLSRLSASREVIAGTRFVLAPPDRFMNFSCAHPATTELEALLQRDAPAVVLAALEWKEPGRIGVAALGDQARVVRNTRGAEVERALEEQLRLAMAGAKIPDRVGVFVEACEQAPNVRMLDLAATFAVLGRRSGCLYLPQRQFEPSLIRFTSATLYFCEES